MRAPAVVTVAKHGLAALLLIGVLGTASLVQAASSSAKVAVMPFRDLSGGSSYVGEAIRETVTSDLKQLGSLRVVERGSLDKVLLEQGLQGPKQELDLGTVVKLGKVLGASLIVVGAYQRLPPQVRLTARFVKVDTSEVVGTAKVDGTMREFLRLQDRITAALLRSAGFPVYAKKVEDDAPQRPDLASMKTLELYGQAVTASTDEQRRQYLQAAVLEDKSFRYAAKDLEELEQRLQRYQAEAQPLHERELASLRAQIRQAPDHAQAALLMVQLLGKLATDRRFYAVVREARSFLEQLPPGAPLTPYVDSVALLLIQYDGSLKDYDAVLRDGEWYLKRAPGSSLFATVQTLLQQAIEQKRRVQESRVKLESALAEQGKDGYWDLCAVGDLCRNAEQYPAALRFYEACSQVGTKPRHQLMPLLLLTASNGGIWGMLHKFLAEWEKFDPREAQKWRNQNQGWFPEDE